MKNGNDKCIDKCNELLRGELSAVTTYEQAIEKFDDTDQVAQRKTLESICNDHRDSAAKLEENIARMGGSPSDGGGIWEKFAETVEGSAKLLGDSPALSALRLGEKHGESEYLEALSDDNVTPECKKMIETTLLPRQTRHIQILEAMRAS